MGATVITYLDDREIFIPALNHYPRGIELKKGDTLKVSEKEMKYFLRQMNGPHKCFEAEKMKRPPRDENNIVEASE